MAAIDEGTKLTCSVVAANAGGAGSAATSKPVRVPVPAVPGCPAATGRLAGSRLGQAGLGMTRAQARVAYRRSSVRGSTYQDVFCLTPAGVRAGYPTPGLLRTLSPKLRNLLAGRVIWATSANPYYATAGIRDGASLVAAQRALRGGTLLSVGAVRWYLVRRGAATVLIKARSGVVQEVGIADSRLTANRRAELALVRTVL